MEKSKEEPSIAIEKPEETNLDNIHRNVKILLSAIPGIGGPAAELFSSIIVPPISKRRDEWIESIAKGLKALAEKVDGFDMESLSQNETFITTVMHASQVAIRNHQKEKLETLRNAVLNSAVLGEPEEDMWFMFLSFVDGFTELHMRVLKFFDKSQEWVPYPRWSASNTDAEYFECVFPDLEERFRLYNQIVKDLYDRGLIEASSLPISPERADLLKSLVGTTSPTDMGKQFLDFVTSPIADDE